MNAPIESYVPVDGGRVFVRSFGDGPKPPSSSCTAVQATITPSCCR